MYEFIIAFALIISGVDIDETLPQIQLLRPSILSIAVDMQIVDSREITFLQLKEIPERLERFANRPLLEETCILPDKKHINDMITINRSFRNQLIERRKIDLIHEEILTQAISECDQLYQIWDCMRDAQCDYYYVTIRRDALFLLRELIGSTAYYSGDIPPALPYWHIPRD